MKQLTKAKVHAIKELLKSRSFVMATEYMCMAAVEGDADTVMVAAQLEAQAHILRGTMSAKGKELTDEQRDKIRLRIVQDMHKKEE